MGDGIGFVSEPAGLDFGAIMAVASARGADITMLAEILPAAEAGLINALNRKGEVDGE